MKENIQLQNLVKELKKKSIEDSVGFWKRVAVDLEKPTKQRRIINLSKISKFCKENEIIVVPGKVLADGELDKKISVAAYAFSKTAKEKILKSQGQLMTIEELMKKNPKVQDLKIMG